MDNPSPLRYPGSKYRFHHYFSAFLEQNFLVGSQICEPYAGGAAVSLSMLRRDLVRRAYLVEKDPLVYCFWVSVFGHTDRLKSMIEEASIDIATWKKLESFRAADKPLTRSIVEMGFAGLFFNRTNYSGIIGAGPIGGMKQRSNYKIDCRFNKATLLRKIDDLSRFSDRVSVSFGDGVRFLKSPPKSIRDDGFVYADPPYFRYGWKFYRFYYSQFEHKRLRDVLDRLSLPWILSYDDSDIVKSLYKKHNIKKLYWYHTARKFKVGSELVVSNVRLPDFEKTKSVPLVTMSLNDAAVAGPENV